MIEKATRHRWSPQWQSLVLFVLACALVAADDGCSDDATGPNRDGIQEEAGTAVIWAKPLWAKVVWEKKADCGSLFSFEDLCGKCPSGYIWGATVGIEPDFCFQCDAGFTFGRYPDGDFCWKCPSGTSPQVFGDGYTCR